jgi:glycosyltransferase involved in cell wall biosynthesis
MKKILFLINDINLQKYGMELANIYLLDILNQQNNVFIINLIFVPEINHHKNIKCNIDINFYNKGFFIGFKFMINFLKNLSKKEKFDSVIISSNHFQSLLYLFIIKIFNLFPKTKIIHWCHTDPFSSIFQASRIPFILYPLGVWLYRKLDFIVATNPYMMDSFAKYYFIKKEKIKLITIPLRREVNNLLKERVNFNFSKPVIVTVTRLTTVQKDPITLLNAFKIVKEKYPKATLLFLGDGPEKEKLKNVAKELGIIKNTVFLGFVKNPLAYVKRSDVFVLSSKSEGTPVVLIEAQACGVPIVATDCPVGPRWILDEGKAGILVKVGDYKQIAEAIINILENKNIAFKLVKNGLAFNSNFSFEKFKKKWQNLLGI